MVAPVMGHSNKASAYDQAFGPASVRLPGASEPAAPDSAQVEMRFQRSGRTLIWNGREGSLLEFAERHAILVQRAMAGPSCLTGEKLSLIHI